MRILSAIQKTNHFVLAAIVAVGLATPALAGGPLEAPDGTGPSLQDLSGWAPVAFIHGGEDGATVRARVLCTNVGNAAANVAVQFYDDGDDPTRQPLIELIEGLPVSDMDWFPTDGTINDYVLIRVLADTKKAAIQCGGFNEAVGGDPVSALQVVYIKKAPKAKFSK